MENTRIILFNGIMSVVIVLLRSYNIDVYKKMLKLRKIRKKIFLIPFAPVLLLMLYFCFPLPKPLFNTDYSTVVTDEDGNMLRVFLNDNEQWCFPPNKELVIPEKLKTAVLYFEDRYFYKHPGVNPVSLVRAFYQNLSSGEIISGASTITMQVSRLNSPKTRTVFHKTLELLQALKIELYYSKNDILHLYLNHAPYGGNIIGFQAASFRYFQKSPEQLTWAEAATLAVLPNAPGLISPTVNKDKLVLKRNRLLRRLFESHIIDKETFQLALNEKIPDSSKPFPKIAAHLTRELKDRDLESPLIRTTINKQIQQDVQELVRQHCDYLSRQGIQNSAALVIETKTGKVRAYIGSQDFFDVKGNGQVDGVKAARSSGSLLKPFLYGLCMDKGFLLPQTVLKDVPSYFGRFSPSNASKKFDGLVSAKEALVRSLNVPAVRLLYNYGIFPFYHFLQAAGISTLFRPADDYGLPLIIGGAEVSVWDMAMMFRGLANGGQFQPLVILTDKNPDEQKQSTSSLISPGACYLTLEMLRELKRPGAEYYWQQYQNQWPLAWKTGTSYGHRDAWAVGTSPEWTIAVWVGNFTGEGNANLGGASCAGPLLFDIFNSLPKNPENSWFTKPEIELSTVDICSETGFLAGPDCEKRETVECPRAMKPLRICPYHHHIYVNKNETYQVCSLCWEQGHHIKRLLEYPPDIVQLLRERGHLVSVIPKHKPGCPSQSNTSPLQILYPQQHAFLWIPRDFSGDWQKLTMRVAHRDMDRTLYWYLDDHYLGSTVDKHTKAAELTRGWHELEVVDEAGNRDRTTFYVNKRM